MGQSETQKKAFKPSTPLAALGGFLFRQRGIIPVPFVIGAIVTLLLADDTMADLGIPFWASVAGCVLFCGIGHVLRVWAIGYAGRETRSVCVATVKLATAGPFAYTRNPIYIGNVLIALGLALMSRTTWVLATFPVLLILEYHAIIRYEEEYLEFKFGDDYRAYRRCTPRYLGFVCRAKGNGVFDLSQTFRKEYQAVLATVSAAAAFLFALWAR